MKIAITIAGDKAKDSAFVVWRGFEKSIRKAAEYGYDGIELALKQAEDLDRSELKRWLRDYHMEVSCITTGQVFADLGLYFTHSDPGMRDKAIQVFYDLIDLAGEFCGLINVGRARGFVDKGQTRAETERLFIDAMQQICERAAQKQVQVIVEPVNRYELNFINNLDEGAEILKRTERKNCGLHADVFHMNIEDDCIGKSLIRNGSWVKYVHLADTNRMAPGLGHLNFDEVFQALECIGYDDWVSVEMLPGKDPDWMARKAIEFLKPRIEAEMVHKQGG